MPAPEAPSLRSLQTAMMALIRAPEGVRTAIAQDDPSAWLLGHIAGDGRASAVARLDLYADMYFYRLLESLTHDYPKLAAALGDEAFHDLITGYLLVHPSQQPSLREAGRALPAYVRHDAASVTCPCLADLAALEWARVDVFDRPDDARLTLADLAEHAASGFATLMLQAITAHALVPTAHDVTQIWRAPGTSHACAAQSPQSLLVWRKPDRFVYHRRVSELEAGCLARLCAPTSFVDLCEGLGVGCDPAEAAATAVRLVTSWTGEGMLRACSCDG